MGQKKTKNNWQKQRKKQKYIAAAMIVTVAVACAVGIGWRIFQNQDSDRISQEAEQSRNNTNSKTVNVDPILDYLSGLDTELLNEEIAPQAVTQQAAASEEAVSP